MMLPGRRISAALLLCCSAVAGFTSTSTSTRALWGVQQQQQQQQQGRPGGGAAERHHHQHHHQRRGGSGVVIMQGGASGGGGKKKAAGKAKKAAKPATKNSAGGFGKPSASSPTATKPAAAAAAAAGGGSDSKLDVSKLAAHWARAANFEFAGSVRPRPMTAARNVPSSIPLPSYAKDGKPKERGPRMPWQIEVKSPKDVEGMVKAGRVAREVLDAAGRAVKAGVTTDLLDQLVHQECVSRGAYPSPLNYHHFPKSVCTSVNEVICHGIPDATVLQAGDLVNVDVTVYFQGYHGDCSETFAVLEKGDDADADADADAWAALDEAGRELVQVTYDCWVAAMDFCEPGKPYKEIGGVIEDYIKPFGYSTVAQFCGHGIGSIFHTNPNILHYRNNEPNGVMAVGHTFTIEPMICEGTDKVLHWPDDWTATTADGRRSAQFEHTLLMTETGVVPLTGKIAGQSPLYPWEKGVPYAGRGSM